MSDWQLQEAKARFSELMRGVAATGPQTITVRGHRAAVILSADDYDRLKRSKPSLGEFLRTVTACGCPAEYRPRPVAAARY